MKKLRKKLLTFLLAAAMFIAAVPAFLGLTGKQVQAATATASFNTFSGLKSAVEGLDYKKTSSLTAVITGNITFTNHIYLQRNTSVTILVNNGVTMNTGVYSILGNVHATLTLGDASHNGTITSRMAKDDSLQASHGIRAKDDIIAMMRDGGTLNINGGSYDGGGTSNNGWGLFYGHEGSTVNFRAGMIHACHCAIQVTRGQFIMTGGTISDTYGDAVVLGESAGRVMDRGKVTASVTGGTIEQFAYSGIWLTHAEQITLDFTGGTIRNRKTETSALNTEGAAIEIDRYACGYANGNSTVKNKQTTVTMGGSASISGCPRGVFVQKCAHRDDRNCRNKFILTGNATITGCVQGAGIRLPYGVANDDLFDMTGGTISGTGHFGAVKNDATGTARISGGLVINNPSYGINNRGTVYISGTADVEKNGTDPSCGGCGCYHDGSLFSVTGTYGSRSNVGDYIYLASDSRFVTTGSMDSPVWVRPNSYWNGRKVIGTDSTAHASAQQGASGLYPCTGWRLRANGSDVVLNNTRIVTFHGWDGGVISSREYPYGSTVTEAAHPASYEHDHKIYSFKNWNPAFNPVCTADADYYPVADITPIKYTVKFIGYDGMTVLRTGQYVWGEPVYAPTAPTGFEINRWLYTFTGWSPAFTDGSGCTGDATYYAQYTKEYLGVAPIISYNGTELTGDTDIPFTGKWLNKTRMKSMKDFTATDPDNDVASFVIRDEADTSDLFTGTGTNELFTIKKPQFPDEGIHVYPAVAADSLGNVTRRNLTLRTDFTPPYLTGDPGTEGEAGQSGLTDEIRWNVYKITGDKVIQTASDDLSGITKVCVYLWSDQEHPIKTVNHAPYTVTVKVEDYPTEMAFVIKTWDQAGNMASKCMVNPDNMHVRIQPYIPRQGV